MSKVADADKKIQILNNLSGLEELPMKFNRAYETMLKATGEVTGSKRLKIIFRIILELHNALSKNRTQPVKGLDFISLMKWNHLKANSGVTIESYLVNKLNSTIPDVLNVQKDFSTLEEVRSYK